MRSLGEYLTRAVIFGLAPNSDAAKIVRLHDQLEIVLERPEADPQKPTEVVQITSQLINIQNREPGKWRVAATHADERIKAWEGSRQGQILQDLEVRKVLVETIIAEEAKRLNLSSGEQSVVKDYCYFSHLNRRYHSAN